jgi:hypothetical protein
MGGSTAALFLGLGAGIGAGTVMTWAAADSVGLAGSYIQTNGESSLSTDRLGVGFRSR